MICRRLYAPEVLQELFVDFNEEQIQRTLNEMGHETNIFLIPDTFIFFLNKITNFDPADVAFHC